MIDKRGPQAEPQIENPRGLARAAHAFEETDLLFDHPGIAEALYRQTGEQEKAEQVLAKRKKLKE